MDNGMSLPEAIDRAVNLAVLNLDHLINASNVMVALFVLIITWLFNILTRRQSLRVERSQAYLSLEVHSSEVFRYEAEHSARLAPYRTVQPPPRRLRGMSGENAMIAYNLYFQTLNLFEVCARFRRQDIIEHQVFASWVSWFFDTLDDWYFREQWDDLRTNYTDDVRDIFDVGMAIFDQHLTDDDPDAVERCRREFWHAVSQIMQCEEIAQWLDKTESQPEWPLRRREPWPLTALRDGLRLPPTFARRPYSSPEP